LQLTPTTEITVDTNGGGSVTVAESINVQPLASATVTLKLPAQRLPAVLVVWVDGSSHVYVYGAIPPDTLAEIEPSHIPEQLAGNIVVATFKGSGSVSVMLAVSVHPLASVTVLV
jgi:hypothetical protein